MPTKTEAPLTNASLLTQLRRLLAEIEARIANYGDADEDPETGDVAADAGLVLASRTERLLNDASWRVRSHRLHFEQQRPDEDGDDA